MPGYTGAEEEAEVEQQRTKRFRVMSSLALIYFPGQICEACAVCEDLPAALSLKRGRRSVVTMATELIQIDYISTRWKALRGEG